MVRGVVRPLVAGMQAVVLASLFVTIGTTGRTLAQMEDCGRLIIGAADIQSTARGIFCADVACAVLDLNGDGFRSAADIPAGLQQLAPCGVQQVPGLLDVGETDDPQRYLVFNRFGAAAPSTTGEVLVPLSNTVPTVTYALSESEDVYAALSFGGEEALRIDSLSTARALVATNPLLQPGDPEQQLTLWELIRTSSAVGALAQSLDAAHLAGRDISDDTDVAASLVAAVVDVLSSFEAISGFAAGTPALPPGECSELSTPRVCNHDMVHLTLAGSANSILRIEPASEGFLRLRTNVDWAARVVQLDRSRLPTDGTNFLFSPDGIDPYIKVGGLDHQVIVRGEVAGGWFLFVVDPIAFLAENLGQLRVPSSFPSLDTQEPGILLDQRDVYAVVAISGSWANDRDEYLSVLASPWQRDLARRAVLVNLFSILMDFVAIGAPIAGSDMAILISELLPVAEFTVAQITDDPQRATDAIAQFLVESSGQIALHFAAVHALPTARRAAVRKFAETGIRSVSSILSVWSSGIRIATRLGGLARNVSPRESGYAVYDPADSFIETIEIPADGTTTQSVAVLDDSAVYRLVISGLYRYDEGERGEFADAQFREDDRDEYSIRYNSVAFDGERLDAALAESDPEQHSFVFYVSGSGAPLSLGISDDNYRDNEGSLVAELYGPRP